MAKSGSKMSGGGKTPPSATKSGSQKPANKGSRAIGAVSGTAGKKW